MSRPATLHSPKRVAGLALLVFGTLILHARFAAALAGMHHMLITTRNMSLVPAIVLTVLQTAEAGDFAEQHMIRTLLLNALFTFRPLFMVVAGIFLSRPPLACTLNIFSKKDF